MNDYTVTVLAHLHLRVEVRGGDPDAAMRAAVDAVAQRLTAAGFDPDEVALVDPVDVTERAALGN